MKKRVILLFSGLMVFCMGISTVSGQNAVNDKPTGGTTLEGKWCNQLGSQMDLLVKGNDMTGSYTTKVGVAEAPRDIKGQRLVNKDGSQLLGFVVTWPSEKYRNSLTSWSGQLQIIDGKETITTMWLLVVQTKPEDNWNSVNINKDVFTRCVEKK